MFGKRIELFTVFGFPIRIDYSWFVIVSLVTWSLAAAVFPANYPGLTIATYWVLGALGALGLFGSIVLHELAHALTARQYGMPMKGITLFIFGGVAEMQDEPPSARAELMVAIAGPIASIVIAAACALVNFIGGIGGWPVALRGLFGYLGLINVVLVAFNMVPAFPLDGGRVLRAVLWHWKRNLHWATRVVSKFGSGFGVLLIALGVLGILGGNPIQGFWWIFIGFFLRSAAQMSFQQLLLRRALEGEPVRRFMSSKPITVSPKASVEDLVNDYIYPHHHKLFPVCEDNALLGCVSTREVKALDRDRWRSTTVEQVMKSCNRGNTVAPDEDAIRALAKMRHGDNSRLLVVENHRLVGILTLKDLMSFIALKIDLEADDFGAAPVVLARTEPGPFSKEEVRASNSLPYASKP